MTHYQKLREELQKLISQKKSKKFYADRLGVEVETIDYLLNQMKRGDILPEEGETGINDYSSWVKEGICKMDEDLQKNQAEITAKAENKIENLEDLIERCQIDTRVWNIDRYIQNFWGNIPNPHWQIKVWLSKKTEEQNFRREFIDFLKTYTLPNLVPITPLVSKENLSKACLILNNQDQHLNKFDILGNNDIERRFSIIYQRTRSILKKVSDHNNIEKIYYIIGSDHFNNEWTGATVRGTKQESLGTYQQSFSDICNHEIRMLNLLQAYSKYIEVIYVSGNHDEYVGWHLATWLQAFFGKNRNISFDTSFRYRKYTRYGKSAIMLNHGDAIKPPKLVNIFPIEFKHQWSSCENYYVFTGDKHHEVTMDFNGIMFYQLPALSTAKSSWDDKNGYTCSKPEMVAFVIDRENGITSIFKERIK